MYCATKLSTTIKIPDNQFSFYLQISELIAQNINKRSYENEYQYINEIIYTGFQII